ncbi:MAG: ORF6N domain-containing protein [Saprospiraceae bacterium]|nr:ORF6N domain-containing protein [Saprospiraceae bacterium]
MELKTIQSRIYEIRGLKVMFDADLATLYEVQTKVLNQAVKRNIDRFPIDFMFQLTELEWDTFQVDQSMHDPMWSQIVTSSQKFRRKSLKPFVFTEQGVAMLSGILNSPKAVEVNIAIMRAFVFMRQYALSHKDLTDKLKQLEDRYDQQFKDVYDAINFLLQKDIRETEIQERKRIGFKKDPNK